MTLGQLHSPPRLAPALAAPPPPLENGDHLTRAEFERRYEAMPHLKKAELIEGIVHMPSPVRHLPHAKPHSILNAWMVYYVGTTANAIEFSENGTVRLDEHNEPQPDLLMFLPPHAGGRARIDGDGYVAGPPDLVCEISASTVSIDLHRKLNVYRRGGVREYLVWRTQDAAIDWFVLREGAYVPITPGADGLLRSEIFPGLWLEPAVLLAGALPQLFDAADQGRRTGEHADFIRRLALLA